MNAIFSEKPLSELKAFTLISVWLDKTLNDNDTSDNHNTNNDATFKIFYICYPIKTLVAFVVVFVLKSLLSPLLSSLAVRVVVIAKLSLSLY